MTDLTYTCVRNKKTISATGSCNLNVYAKTENLNNTSEEKEKYNYSTHNSQNYAKNTFIKPLISNSKEDIIPVVQTKNIKALCDEDNKQSIKSDIIPSRKVNKLKDIVQEDKLNIIINNLADRNCSPKYIDKIIQMLDCLDYIASYKTGSECNNNSANHETSKSETIPLQPSLLCNDNLANTNKLENKLTELNTIGHSTDLGYGSIRNDSNAIQLSNPSNIKPEYDKDSDESENEIYVGVPKISIGRVLKARETSRKMYKRKERKKTIYPDAQKHATNLSYDAEEIEPIHVVNPINTKKNSLSDESCISITEDEVETTNMRECHKTVDITQKPQEMTFSSYREPQRNFDMYKESKSITRVQNKQLFDTSDVFVKEQKIPYRVQENVHSQFVADIDYTTNSDIDVVTVSSNTRKTGGNMASHAKMDQDTVMNENNSDFLEKSCASPKLRKEFIEQTSDLSKSEIAINKSKPTIISLMPVNLNLRIKADAKAEQLRDSNIIVKNKSNANIRSLEEIDKKKSMSKTLIATKPVINDSHSKTAIDNRREVCPITNNNKTNNINPTTNPTTIPTTEQPKNSKLGVKENPQVLTAWMPKVVYYAKSKSELGLTFQGKLLK